MAFNPTFVFNVVVTRWPQQQQVFLCTALPRVLRWTGCGMRPAAIAGGCSGSSQGCPGSMGLSGCERPALSLG